MLSIDSAHAFFKKTKGDFESHQARIDDPSLAINSILSLYHLHEWVWSHWLKGNFEAQKALGIRNNLDDFLDWLERHCPYFNLIQDLANGSKHAYKVHSSGAVEGFGAGPYGIGPYGAPYLLIDLGEEASDRYLVASDVTRDCFGFWADFFSTHNIGANPEA